MRISIRAVNGCQSKVLVFRQFKTDYQGFIFCYDTEITIPIFFVYKLGHVLQRRQHLLSGQLSDRC